MISKMLSEITSVITKGTTPTSVGCSFSKNGINYIKSESITSSRTLDKSKYAFISEETHQKLKRSQIKENDILFSMAGMFLGKTGIVQADDVPANTNQAVAIIRIVPEQANYLYVYYYLNQKNIVTWINSLSGQSAQPNINLKQIGEIEIPLPDRIIQDTIVEMLSAIDSRIELNTAINENLEQQAQAIYRSMFVILHHDSDRMGLLSELITVKYGKDHKKLNDGIYPVYGSGGIMRYVERPLYDKESVLIPRKGSLNNVMYVNEPFWSVDTMFYTEMKQPNVAKFVFHFVKSKDLASLNAGSAVPSMTTDILNSMELRIPSADRLAEFEGLVAPLYRVIEDNIRQSAHLADLRDTLLPKLMNGEIDVSAVKV